jgi:hypothetical protein
MALSVNEALRGSIFMTGGLGFLGSVCLEQLLARSSVRTIRLYGFRKPIGAAPATGVQHLASPLCQTCGQFGLKGCPVLSARGRAGSLVLHSCCNCSLDLGRRWVACHVGWRKGRSKMVSVVPVHLPGLPR